MTQPRGLYKGAGWDGLVKEHRLSLSTPEEIAKSAAEPDRPFIPRDLTKEEQKAADEFSARWQEALDVAMKDEVLLLTDIRRVPWSHWRAGMPEQDMVEIERLAKRYDVDPRVLWCAWAAGHRRGKR